MAVALTNSENFSLTDFSFVKQLSSESFGVGTAIRTAGYQRTEPVASSLRGYFNRLPKWHRQPLDRARRKPYWFCSLSRPDPRSSPLRPAPCWPRHRMKKSIKVVKRHRVNARRASPPVASSV